MLLAYNQIRSAADQFISLFSCFYFYGKVALYIVGLYGLTSDYKLKSDAWRWDGHPVIFDKHHKNLFLENAKTKCGHYDSIFVLEVVKMTVTLQPITNKKMSTWHHSVSVEYTGTWWKYTNFQGIILHLFCSVYSYNDILLMWDPFY